MDSWSRGQLYNNNLDYDWFAQKLQRTQERTWLCWLSQVLPCQKKNRCKPTHTQTLFVKWLNSHSETVEELVVKAQKGELKASQYAPLFSHHKVPLNNPSLNASSINLTNTITPPRASFDEKGIPLPTSESYKRGMNDIPLNMIRSTFTAKTSGST